MLQEGEKDETSKSYSDERRWNMVRTLNFKNKEAYRKWNAFGHIRTKTGLKVTAKAGRKSLFDATPGYTKIKVRGVLHTVTHST